MPEKIIDFKIIKRKLELMSCPIHNKKPEMMLLKDNFRLKCCCDNFQKKLIEKAQEIMVEQAQDYIIKKLQKSFKE